MALISLDPHLIKSIALPSLPPSSSLHQRIWPRPGDERRASFAHTVQEDLPLLRKNVRPIQMHFQLSDIFAFFLFLRWTLPYCERFLVPPKKCKKWPNPCRRKIFLKNQSEGKDHIIHIHRENAWFLFFPIIFGVWRAPPKRHQGSGTRICVNVEAQGGPCECFCNSSENPALAKCCLWAIHNEKCNFLLIEALPKWSIDWFINVQPVPLRNMFKLLPYLNKTTEERQYSDYNH